MSDPRRITLPQRWQRFWYLYRVHEQMPNVSSEQWDTLRKELVADTDEAAAHVGMRQALADLGPAKDLAAHYNDALDLRRGPLWARGIAALVITAAALVVIALAYQSGMSTALAQTQSAQEVTSDFLGVRLSATADGLAGAAGWPQFGIPTLAMIVFGRLWRMVPACRPKDDQR
ncbi:MAG: hypothetical protein FWF75_04570 [Propionibacteriaceae bacterium]|nr:hypothetical protein [Propionibacteriaceae bacterium]